MRLSTISVHFKSAPAEVRAQAAKLGSAGLEEIAPGWHEKLWLQTCNRVEIYGVGVELAEVVRKRWADRCGISSESFEVFEQDQAVEHLFRVASSLDSMVVGETQITGQAKKAYDHARVNRTLGPILNRTFQRAFKVAKRIRNQTEVGRLQVSIPSIGVKLAENILGDLETKRIGIVGLGQIGRLAAEHFASIQPRCMYVYNRTQSTAHALVQQLKSDKLEACVCEQVNDVFENADVLVIAADGIRVGLQDLRRFDERGPSTFVLDLAVPASVERCALENVFVYSIDDLQKIAEDNSSLRQNELRRAEQIIADEAAFLWGTLQTANLSQTLGRLATKVDLLTSHELASLRTRMGHLPEKDWDEIEKMAYRLGNKIVQDPVVEIKSCLETEGESENLVRLKFVLFDR